MSLFATDFDNQMNIWSFVSEDYPKLDDIDSEQAANLIGERTGIPFKAHPDYDIYTAKVGGFNFSVKISTYSFPERLGQKFISVDAMKAFGDFEGCCQGVDSIEEAVSFFERMKTKFFSAEEAA